MPTLTDRCSIRSVTTLMLSMVTASWAASPVAISNAGFEDPVLSEGAAAAAADWTNVGNGGTAFHPGAGSFSGGAAEGDNVGSVFNGADGDGFSQVLAGATGQLQVDATYVLTVQVGDPADADFGGYKVQLLADGTVLGEDDNTLAIPDDGFATATVNYTYNAGLHAALVGEPLEVRILSKGLNSGTNDVAFDDVQLTVALLNPLADPGGPYAVPTSAGSLALDGSGSLPSDGETISAYDWDLDNDGDFDEAISGATPTAISSSDLQTLYGMTVGSNTIKLRVTDTGAKTSTVEGTVNLTALPTPVAYWPMRDGLPGTVPSGSGSVDDVIDDAGHPATDATPNNNNSSFEADPTRGIVWSTTEGNRLNAGQQGINLNVDSGWTWSLWVKASSSNITDPGADCLMGTRAGSWNKLDRTGASNWINPTYPDWADDTWRHVVFVGDATGAQVYYDGVPAGPKDTTFNSPGALGDKSTLKLEIGGTSQYSEDVTGLYSDVAVWNVALTPSEIADLANGANVIPDTTAPFLAATTPEDDDPAAPVGDLLAIFDEPVQVGTGDIRIFNLTDVVTTTIDVTDASQVTVSGASITISPTVALLAGKAYAVEMDAGVVSNAAGLPFAGIADQTTWNFTTDATPPVVVSLSPADDTLNAGAGALVMEFDEVVVPGTGNFTLKNLTDVSNAPIDINDAQITFVDNTITIAPTGGLLPGKAYAVQIDATAIENLSGFTYAGIADDTTWNFSVATETTITGTDGGSDSWNTASNWSAGVPIGNLPAFVATGVTAQVNNSGTPAHAGGLTLESGSTLRINNTSGSENAVGSGTLTMTDATMQIETQFDQNYPDLVLNGNNQFRSQSNATHGRNRNYGGVISGSGSMTFLKDNRAIVRFQQTNTFGGGIVFDAEDRYLVEFEAVGSAGGGDVTVNPRTNADDRSAILKLEASDVFADTATLTLDGQGNANSGWPSGSYNGIFLEMGNNTDTIAALVVGGVAQPTGTYGRVGLGTVDNEVSWILGDGVLTVSGGGGAPPYDTWAGTFPSLSDSNPELDFDGGSLETGLEWVLGGDPTDATDDAGIAPTLDNTDADFFKFTYRLTDEAAADGNTAIKAEYGSDLVGWTEAVHDGTDVIITTTPDGAAPGVALVEVQLRRSALAVGDKIFARLNVEVTVAP